MSSPVQGGRRRLDASVEPEYDLPTREPRIASERTARFVLLGVFAMWVIGTLGAATSVVAIGAPDWIQRPSAALLMLVFTTGLIHRGGGHMRIWIPIVVLLGGAAVLTEINFLIASSAVVCAAVSAVWAILVTRPAPTMLAAIREYALSLTLALSGTLSVAAWNAPVNYQRFNFIILSVSLAMVIALIWNLGAGLHGLGKQNLLALAGVAALLLVILGYSSFVRTHGSQTIVDAFSELVLWSRQNFEGVPRPVEVFIGFPALIVGVSMRSTRREGWWVLVFAVIGTAVLSTSLVTPGAYPSYVGLSTLYSVILGLIVGLIVRHYVVRQRSARSARAIEPIARVEPPRFAALK